MFSLSLAHKEYVAGCELLMNALKKASGDEEKKELREHAEFFINKTEIIKSKLDKQKNRSQNQNRVRVHSIHCT